MVPLDRANLPTKKAASGACGSWSMLFVVDTGTNTVVRTGYHVLCNDKRTFICNTMDDSKSTRNEFNDVRRTCVDDRLKFVPT